MITIKHALVGFFSGTLLTLSWVLFIDGHVTSNDRFPGTHVLPPLFATVSAVALNLVSINDLIRLAPRVWLFFWITAQCTCIGAAIFILSTEYPPNDNYTGIAIMLQTVLCMMASFIFFVGRKRSGGE